MLNLVDVLLFFFLAVTALGLVRLRDLFAATMLLSLFSLLSAGLFIVMDAVDVAITEAAVGAGISTMLLLATLAITKRREKAPRREVELVPLMVVLVVGGALVWGTLEMPEYGDPDAPSQTSPMTRHFLEKSRDEVGAPNIVTSILASYRGYDTFGEATVIFTAAVGALMLLGGRRPKDARLKGSVLQPLNRQSLAGAGADEMQPKELHLNRILEVATKSLVPFIMMFGLYVQFHGDYGPGGGFQAGVIFATGVALYALVFGLTPAQRVLPPRLLEALLALGVFLFGAIGLWTMVLGGNFLEYGVLSDGPLHGQHLGILLVELAVGITVAAVMLALFFLFAGRGFCGPQRKR
ncbi:MAG: DUF4040 domain-containing protein [Acidobacteriota bacterium]